MQASVADLQRQFWLQNCGGIQHIIRIMFVGFFFFTGLNFTFRYLSCYCGIWNAPAIFSFQCFGKHSVSQPN